MGLRGQEEEWQTRRSLLTQPGALPLRFDPLARYGSHVWHAGLWHLQRRADPKGDLALATPAPLNSQLPLSQASGLLQRHGHLTW